MAYFISSKVHAIAGHSTEYRSEDPLADFDRDIYPHDGVPCSRMTVPSHESALTIESLEII